MFIIPLIFAVAFIVLIAYIAKNSDERTLDEYVFFEDDDAPLSPSRTSYGFEDDTSNFESSYQSDDQSSSQSNFEIDSHSFDDNSFTTTNPATGLPMFGDSGIDVGGSPFGSDIHSFDDSISSFSDDSFSSFSDDGFSSFDDW